MLTQAKEYKEEHTQKIVRKGLNLKGILDACIGLGTAGALLGVTGYYCLRTLGESSSRSREPLSLNKEYASPRENNLGYTPYSADVSREIRPKPDILLSGQKEK